MGRGAAQMETDPPAPAGAKKRKAAPAPAKAKLVGADNFVRRNPRSDRFGVRRFHHVEFWCGDANTTYRRFAAGLGLTLVAKSDHSTGNTRCGSYVCASGELTFAFTAPYSLANVKAGDAAPLPAYDPAAAHAFVRKHGLAVRAVAVEVEDAAAAYAAAVAHGAVGVTPPARLAGDKWPGAGAMTVAEVALYGDAVLRLVSGGAGVPCLPGYDPVQAPPLSYGLERVDHVVGNVPNLLETVDYVAGFTGFHEFAEFTAEDVGTVDSGLNSMVLANNNEFVLLPINEPTFGTKRKSQIQTFLEQNEGPGVQHIALKTPDILGTLTRMRAQSLGAGFEFMPKPSEAYYRRLPAKVGDALTAEEYRRVEELGILVDKDDQGVLLQIFTKPLGDRPTIFVEIIQRLGCALGAGGAEGAAAGAGAAEGVLDGPRDAQAAGCGGFGKGNFSELFKSIERYERTLDV